jgi:hypothetical protein
MKPDLPFPITGSPPPHAVYTWPNTINSEFVSDIRVCSSFAISLTSRGHIALHQTPTFELITSKRLPGVICAFPHSSTHLLVLQSSRPFLYDLSFSIFVSFLKRPTLPTTDDPIFSSASLFGDHFVASTTSSAICLWDLRSSDPPHVLSLPSSTAIQSVSMSNEMIVAGLTNGRLSILDTRNPRTRLATFDIETQLTVANSRKEYTIVQSQEEPWIVGFQYINGPSGILDVMSGKVSHVFNAPPFSAERRYAKPRPLFYRGALVVGYPWSKVLQFCNYQRKEEDEEGQIELEMEFPPIALDGDDDIDGIFIASSDGDIVHVM